MVMTTTNSLCAVLVAGAFLAGPIGIAEAAPKSGPNGESCIETGTARRDGKDQDGNKVNCLWDYCKYCDQSGGTINCSIQKTSYSNPRDCKPAAAAMPGGATIGPQSVDPGRLAPEKGTPPRDRAPVHRPGGTIQKLQQQ